MPYCRYGSDLPILKTIGYRESSDVLNKNLPIDKAIEITSTKTIQFAKRQKTWFRNKNSPIWLNNKNLLKDAIIKIESFWLTFKIDFFHHPINLFTKLNATTPTL